MNKHPVNSQWFEQLHTANLEYRLKWLAQLSPSVESVVSFGCWRSSEPLALMWTLNATEVAVVEKEEKYLTYPRDERNRLKKREPSCFVGGSIEFITADMLMTPLQSNRFDLAYCKDVLYQIEEQLDSPGVQRAINEMARIVRLGGWIIAVEPKIGVETRKVTSKTFTGGQFCQRIPVGDPEDISSYFRAAGLTRVSLNDNPDWSYCYRKPSASEHIENDRMALRISNN